MNEEVSVRIVHISYIHKYINRQLLTVYTIYIHLFFTYDSTVCLQSIQCIDLHGLLDVHRSRL